MHQFYHYYIWNYYYITSFTSPSTLWKCYNRLQEYPFKILYRYALHAWKTKLKNCSVLLKLKSPYMLPWSTLSETELYLWWNKKLDCLPVISVWKLKDPFSGWSHLPIQSFRFQAERSSTVVTLQLDGIVCSGERRLSVSGRLKSSIL